MKRRIFHMSAVIICLILVFCLTACGSSSSETLQETNDTIVHENMSFESQVRMSV